MENKTEKILGEILSVSRRIESKLSSGSGGNDNATAGVDQLLSGISGNIVSELNEIKKETRKTNHILGAIDKNIQQLANSNGGLNILGEILSVNRKIESKISSGSGGNDNATTSVEALLSGISGNIVSELNEIKKETQKTNNILGTIGKNIEQLSNGGLNISNKGTENLSNIIKETARAVSRISKISEGKLEIVSTTIKNIIMVSLLRDPKTGNEYASERDVEKGEKTMNILQRISGGILKFGASMALFAVLAVPAAVGALLFATIVRGVMAILKPVAISEDTEQAINSLQKLGMGVALFGITMAAFSLVAPLIAKGALTFVMVVGVMGVSLLLLHGILKLGGRMGITGDTKNSNTPLGSLYQLGIGIAAFGITMVLFGLVKEHVWAGMGVFTAVLGIAAVAIVGVHLLTNMGRDKTGKSNSPLGSLWKVGLGIAAFGVIMILMGIPKVKELIMSGAGVMAMTLAGLAGTLMLFGLKIVQRGTKSLIAATIALGGVVATLAVYSLVANRLTWESIGMLGAVLVGLGGAMAAAGAGPVPGFIVSGSAAMVVAGAALITISGGLLIYSKAAEKLTWDNIGMLGAAVIGLGTSMAAAGAVSFLIAPGAAVMLLAAAALYPITKSLEIFQRVGWKESDTENLKFAVGGVRQAFASGGVREWARAGFGALMASRMGKSLVGLAGGVESFANMSFTEFEYDEKTGEMKPVKVVKLTKDDIKGAAENIGMVLTTLITPLTEFGDMIVGSAKSGNFFQRIGFQKSGVERGIKSFERLGGGIANLATGVQDWANMTVVEWGVVDNQLVPVRKRPLKTGPDGDIANATKNISSVISALIEPISEFGKIFEGKKGRGLFGFGKTDIEKGLESFSLVSDSIASLATGVQNWVDLKFVTYKVKDGQLVPDDVNEIGETQLNKAGENLTKVLNTLVQPIVDWADTLNRSERKKLNRGMEYVEEISKSIDTLVKTVKTSTDEVSKLSESSNINDLNTFTDWFNRFTNIRFEPFSRGFRGFPKDIKNLYKGFQPFTKGDASEKFNLFTQNITSLAKTHSEFDKFVTSFDKMTNSMERFTTNFKGFMPEGITAFSMWTKTLGDAIEIGRSENDGMMDSFLNASNKTIDSAFQFGQNLLGRGEDETSDTDRSTIIDETIRQESKDDPKMELLIQTISNLQTEINGLKRIMSGEMQVYVTGVDTNASIKISDL